MKQRKSTETTKIEKRGKHMFCRVVFPGNTAKRRCAVRLQGSHTAKR